MKVFDVRGYHARLARFEKVHGVWHRVGDAWPVSIGRNGIGKEREGDGKTPAGYYGLEDVYGYHDIQTAMPFFLSTNDTICVDDSRSRYYNRIVEASNVKKDYRSFEWMRRDDALYEVVVTVGYNQARRPGRGSCIFLHIASGDKPTAGCVAMKRDRMVELVQWLDPKQVPFILVSD
ncbi:L,D-transpeptidase family protein [Hydrogenimonas cancrithermarum]|uniref:L,D-transpeptidase family protein n=1 Tax=Hydrogenimonas cancrithermarum TaxID=2993563 RepID=UPI0025744E15|nr:L,D-transpeptidase family protein [Hydrogenimonas cancrithermarum]